MRWVNRLRKRVSFYLLLAARAISPVGYAQLFAHYATRQAMAELPYRVDTSGVCDVPVITVSSTNIAKPLHISQQSLGGDMHDVQLLILVKLWHLKFRMTYGDGDD